MQRIFGKENGQEAEIGEDWWRKDQKTLKTFGTSKNAQGKDGDDW